VVRRGLSADLTEDEAEAELREVLPAVEEVRLLFGAQGKFRHGAHVAFGGGRVRRPSFGGGYVVVCELLGRGDV